MSQSSSNEIYDLLETWGLSDLKAKFKANYIVLQALEYLTEADIIELIPKIGQRAIFRARLHQWLQQKTPTNLNVPEPKKIKLEPGIEVKSQPQSFQQQLQQKIPQQLQQQQQLQLQQQQPIEQQISPLPSPPNVVHKVYGNLKITSNPKLKRINRKANNLNNAQTPNIQSRVQQFIIGSPPSTTTTTAGTGICRLPSPPSVTNTSNGTRIAINSPSNSLFYNLPPNIECRRFPAIAASRPSASPQIHTAVPNHIHTPVSNQILTPVSTRIISSDNLSNVNTMACSPLDRGAAPTFAADLTPFATSIIRVETNCETQYPNNGESSLQNPVTKFKRTTIIQKLTPDKKTTPPQTKMPKPMIMPKPIEKLKNPPTVTILPKVANYPEVPTPKTILVPKEEPIEIIEDDEDTLDATDWNDFCEKRTNPEKPPEVEKEPDAEPEHLAEPEEEPTEAEALPEAGGEAGGEARGEAEPDPEPNPEVEEFTLGDDVTEIPDLIKDEVLDLDSRSDHDGNDNNNEKQLLEEIKDPKENQICQNSQEPKADITRLDIRNVLMSSKLGRQVIKRYVAEEILDEPTRRLLVETVAQYCFDNKIHITPTYCKDIAEEIIEIFPNERMEDYWMRKGRKLRPPIYNKFHVIRQNYLRKKALADQKPPINNKEIEKKLSRRTQENDYDDDDNLIIS